MRRTTLVSAEDGGDPGVHEACVGGSLKVFFSYAPCSGTTAAMLDEAQSLTGSGRDVFVAEDDHGQGGRARPFDLDQVLTRRPDLVVLENLALTNPPGSRNRTRYKDAEELLRAGIDVYATLRVSDLQNEQDRVRALGVEVPPDPVPDYMLYGAAQLEFVDIDPSELTARAKAAGREIPDQVLNELRVMALRCVSAYAASAGAPRAELTDVQGASPAPFAQKRVVAVVEEGVAPGTVLLEASRLANAARADLEVVCVRRPHRPSSAAAAREEAAFEQLDAQVGAMGLTLRPFFGDDPAEVVRDYLRSTGASDLVVARRRTTMARRLLAPLQPPFEERAVEGLAGVGVHLVAQEEAGRPLGTVARRTRSSMGMRPRDAAVAVGSCLLAFALIKVLQSAGFGDTSSYLVFLGAFIGVAAFTRAFAPSLTAVALGCIMQDYFFIRSYYQLSIDHRASLVLFLVFAVVSVFSVVAVVGVGRAADLADARERRTQALFDLNRSLLYAHSAAEVVDIALGAVVNLFGRSAALYRRDPFAETPSARHERRAATRVVEGDLDGEAFGHLVERSIAHWVFSNGEPAGSGTDTHGESYIVYLPLSSEEGIEGVLAVSDRRALSPGDRSFLGLVSDQVAYALERQSLASKHRGDLHVMHTTDVRGSFARDVVASMAVVSDTVHVLSDALIGVAEEDRAYREVLLRSVAEESSRGKLMAERMRALLDQPVDPVCDVRAEVAAAVAEVRAGLSGKAVELEPGESAPPIVADAALVRAAVRMVLEASTSYIAKCGTVEVSVASYSDRVSVVIADDRPPSMGSSRTAAFELSGTATGTPGGPSYDETRARALREALLDRAAITGDQQGVLAALCRAMRLPEEVARSEGDREGQLNRQRIMRFDRLEYGLYMAALIVSAHGGTIKQRYRLGGGSVVTITLLRT